MYQERKKRKEPVQQKGLTEPFRLYQDNKDKTVRKMNMKDYEKQAEELTKQAQKLEATMLTFKALQDCVKNGFDFDFWIDEENKAIQGMCSKSGIYIRAENYKMWFTKDNEEGFGDLAGMNIEDIDLEEPAPPSQETSETDETPTLPLESEADSSGTYRVDVSSILGRNEE